MILLGRQAVSLPSPEPASDGRATAGAGQDCLLLGAGLIGAAVLAELRGDGFTVRAEKPSYWHDTERRQAVFSELTEQLNRERASAQTPLHVAWCAGSGSLSSTDAALEPERAAFIDTLKFASALAEHRPLHLHYVSSAGGLFEGQRFIGPDTLPAPRSAYGRMKLDQEALLKQRHHEQLQTIIYRPSTVYGSHAFHRRAGLVSHIMWNALRATPTTLEANIHALRDYVHNADVARYMAAQITRAAPESPTPHEPREPQLHHLVSAKPSSILEVFRRVERLMGRSLLYRLHQAGTNNADITFADRLLPKGWTPAPLEVGLAQVWRETRKAFLEEAHAA